MRRMPLRLWGLAVLSGLLQVLPYPIAGPVPVWRTHVAWVALVPLLWAVLGDNRDRSEIGWLQGAALGYVSGFCWYLGSCYWIFQTMHIYGGLAEPVAAGILVLFCLYLGLYHALFGGLLAFMRHSRAGRQGAILLTPVLWVAVELARSRITGFPWDLFGVTQVDNPLLRQLAPWTGVCGISFVIAAVNALWLLRISVRERRWTRPAMVAAGVLIVATYSLALLHPRPHQPATGNWGTATLLQENLNVGVIESEQTETEQQMLEAFSALSRRPSAAVLNGIPEVPGTRSVRRQQTIVLHLPEGISAVDRAYEPTDLVVWPESPAPFREGDPGFRSAMSSLAREMAAPVIVGNIGVDAGRTQAKLHGVETFNSATFIRPDGGFAGRYDKMHLVPFGEYVPYKRLFFFAGSLLQEVGTFEPGKERRVFSSGGRSFGTFICYESIFGDEIREFSTLGAEVLVNISNDGWYGDTSAPWQHLNMVRMRALENHRWVLRATNTGITSVIDPDGRVVAAAPRHTRTAIRVPFRYEQDITFYARYGDLLPWGSVALTVAALALAAWSRRTHRPEERALPTAAMH